MMSVGDTLALGTAQLGQPYGIANRTGQPDETLAHAILEQAVRLGVRYFDTAQGYGHSEEIIGDYMRRAGGAVPAELRIVTKLSTPHTAGAAELEASLQRSWERLGGAPIWGMLLHRETMLDHWEGRFGDTLRRWQDRGRIIHLGVSIHTPEGMSKAIDTPGVDIIQAPANAADRRMHRAGLFARAEAAGKRLFVRSVFLQGLMLLEPNEAVARLPLAAGVVTCLDAFCTERGIGRRAFAVGYARHRTPKALLVIGSETPAQVTENSQLVAEQPGDSQLFAEWDATWPEDVPGLVDPSTWPVQAP